MGSSSVVGSISINPNWASHLSLKSGSCAIVTTEFLSRYFFLFTMATTGYNTTF